MNIMKQPYDIQPEDLAVIQRRVEIMFDLAEEQFDAHPLIVAIAILGTAGARLGRSGIENLIDVARGMRQTFIDGEKADARAARQERRHGPQAR